MEACRGVGCFEKMAGGENTAFEKLLVTTPPAAEKQAVLKWNIQSFFSSFANGFRSTDHQHKRKVMETSTAEFDHTQ
jgi:hypothetical protein